MKNAYYKWLMDALLQRGYTVIIQLGGSALAFGLVHAVWGLMRGSFTAAARAMLATGALGLTLGIVYVASRRVVAGCVAAHFLINLFVAPGLILAAVRGEMSAAPAPGPA